MRQRPYWLGEPHLVDDLAAAGGSYPQLAPPAMAGRAPFGYQAAGYSGRQAIPYNRIMPTVPGAPALGFRDQSVGLGVASFTATSGTALPLTGSPGRPFKGRRLMLDTTRAGTTSTALASITAFLIGDVNQLVGSGSLLVSAFAPSSFGADGQYSACAPALSIKLTIQLTGTALVSPDTITIGGQMNGETIGS